MTHVVWKNPENHITEIRNKVLQQQEEAVSVSRLQTMKQPEDSQKKTWRWELIYLFFYLNTFIQGDIIIYLGFMQAICPSIN